MDSLAADHSFDRQFDQLPDSAWDNVLEACERFEADWQANVQIEDHLPRDDSIRQLLLLKLLAIDIEKRRQVGEAIEIESYKHRFPKEEAIVQRALAEVGLAAVAGDDAPTQSTYSTSQETWLEVSHFPDLQNYELLQVIGRGGMGVVYKARQKRPNRIVALKMISSPLASLGEVNRFHVESDLTAKLDHPNIISIYEVGEHQGCPFFSMRYVDCQSLKELHQEPLASRRAAEYVHTIALAVQHAHDHGILHRDIKPSNILIDDADTAFLTDFGIAKRISSTSDLTASGQVIGTPSFMPPEQAQGRVDQIDERSDVYALGALLYTLLTGHPPFEAAEAAETLRQVVSSEPIRPRQSNPGIERDIETVCLKCLEKPPRKRYASAQELAEDLARFLAREPIHARPVGSFERTWRWCRRKPAQASAAVMALAVFCLAATVAIVSSVAATTQRELTADAERQRYTAEVGQTMLRYELALRDTLSPVLREYSAKTIMPGHLPIHAATAPLSGARSWDSQWLEQQASVAPEVQGRLAESEWGLVDLDVSPDGKSAVAADEGGLLLLWDLETGRVTRRLQEGRYRSAPRQTVHYYLNREKGSSPADWGPCFVDVEWIGETTVVAASLDGSATLFDSETGIQTDVFRAAKPLFCVGSGQDRLLFGDAGGGLSLRSIQGAELASLETERGAVTVTRWLAERKVWIAGFENGTVAALEANSLEPVAEMEFSGPIWSIDAVEAGEQVEIAIGCNAALPELARFTDGDFEIVKQLRFPETDVTASAVHQVRFSEDGSRLYAANDRGYLTQWRLPQDVAYWSARIAGNDSRNRPLRDLVQDSGHSLPLVFDRRVAAVHEIQEGGRIVTAGEDMVIKVLNAPESSPTHALRLTIELGANPRIEFDPQRDDILWGIGVDGVLQLFDVKQNAIIAKRSAHEGGRPGIAVAKGADLIATVGGDNSIRLWRAGRKKIVPAGAKNIKHTAKLMSVALTEKGELVAAVDVNSYLGVWRTGTGEQVFFTPLYTETDDSAGVPLSRPLTGTVAFNPTGSLLAAFGPGQSAFLFSTRPFRGLDNQFWIAGGGGTAMIWNPRAVDVIFAGDNHPRYVTAAVDRKFHALEDPGHVALKPCVAMRATPDKKRIVSLEEGGRVVFMETGLHLQLMEMTHPRRLDSDLSFDRSGNLLALAGRDGSVEVLSVLSAATNNELIRADRSQEWSRTDLISPTALVPRADSRSIAFDSQGRLNLLATLARSEDFRDEGELYFLRSDGNSLLRERIVVDGTTSDRRVVIDATGLAIDDNDNALIVFRRRTAVGTGYDGNLHIGSRRGPEDWEFETVHEHGNWGFYPLLRLDREGRAAEVHHFSFAGFRLVRSYPEADAAEWAFEFLGRVGDGLHMNHAQTPDGRIHHLFQWNPINSHAASKVYSRHSEKESLWEVVDSFASVSQLRTSPDGDLFVMADKEERRYLLRRDEGGWNEYCDLPEGAYGSFQVMANDEVYVGPQWDSETGEFLLWHREQDSWKLEIIARWNSKLEPNWQHLLRDHRGRPAVVFGRVAEPYGWIKVLTLK